jgi:hypothetical protein
MSAASAVNDRPVASPDSYTTLEDTPLSLNVTSNDIDVDSTSLTPSICTKPANGTAVVNTTTKIITYTPAPNFNGLDSFRYRVSDGILYSACVNVTINVTAGAHDCLKGACTSTVLVSGLFSQALLFYFYFFHFLRISQFCSVPNRSLYVLQYLRTELAQLIKNPVWKEHVGASHQVLSLSSS